MIKDKLGDYKKIASLGDIVLTDFLDFEEQNEIYALEKSHIEIELFGGFDDAERKRALIGSSNNNPSDKNYVSLFWGSSQASNWGQAVSVATTRCGGNFDASQIKQGGYFYVEYDGQKNQLELILQSLSGANNWGKVSISESGSANGHYFAKYSYDNCVSALGTNDFYNKLDKIYVGAKEGSVKVYSVCYCY